MNIAEEFDIYSIILYLQVLYKMFNSFAAIGIENIQALDYIKGLGKKI